MIRLAFTMFELVFIVAIIGIIGVSVIPLMKKDNIGEAANQIARHIRLTQHHALVEDMFDPSDSDWAEKMWRIRFIKNGTKQCYVVFADRNKLGNANNDETAIDVITRKPVYANNSCTENFDYSSDSLIWKKYGVDEVKLAQGCAKRKHIAFDHSGRPLQVINSIPKRIKDNCMILIHTNDGHTAEITIYKETGFVKVTKIDNSIL